MMASNRRRALASLALLGALTVGRAAYAEPTAAEKETARQQMNTGRERREKQDLPGALKAFQAADAIMRVPTTGYEVAVTQAELGQLVEARDTLLRVLRIAESPSDPAPFKEARRKAQAMSDALEERIPALKITLKGAPEGAATKVAIDNVTIPDAALGAPFRVNPGHHVVSAKSDNAAGEQATDVNEREVKPVEVTLTPTTAVATTPPEPSPDDKPPEDKPPSPPPPSSRGLGTVTWVGFGVAAAGLVAGSVTGLMSMSSTSSAQSGCRNNQCPPSTWNDLDSASTMATVSTISFIVAGVGAGVGIYGLLTRPKSEAPATTDETPKPADEKPPEARLRVTPWIGLGSAGVRGSF